MAKGQDLPSWATKGAAKSSARAKADPSLPSWAGRKQAKAPAAGNGGAVVVASSDEHKPGFFSRFASDLKDTAVHSPGGVYALVQAGGKDTAAVEARIAHAFGGHGSHYDEKALKEDPRLFGRSRDVGKAVVTQTAADFQHPLRHPGNTFLDALALVSAGAGTAARVGAAGKVLKDTGEVGKAAKTLAKTPDQGVRTFEHQGVKVQQSGSRNAAVRAAHKTVIDPLLQRFPDVPAIGAAAKVSKGIAREARQEKNLRGATIGTFTAKAKAAGMLKRQGKPTRGIARYTQDALARQHALRVVAEGVPIEKRVATHEDYLNRGYNAKAKTDPEIAAVKAKQFSGGHQEQLKLNEAANKYVRTVNGVPRFRPGHKDLIEAYEWAKHTTGSREELLQLIDKLDAETIAGRKAAPAREFFGTDAAGDIRIPTVPGFKEARTKAPLPEMGSHGAVNLPQAPGSLTHPYEGKAYKGGKIRNDVVNLINESAQEAQRYWTLVHVTDRIKAAVKDFPDDLKHDIPIKVEALPGQASMKETRAIVEASHSDPSKLAALSHTFDTIRDGIFPKMDAKTARHLNDQAIHSGDIPGYKFVDSRLLGGLNARNPLIGWHDHKVLRGVLQVADGINNVSKVAILYLKPAYIAPNLLGNTALLLTQQGFAAPKNLAEAARLNAKIDKHTYQQVLAAVGEGVTGSLESSSGGLAGRAANAGAHFYGTVVGVDKYPRVAAFLYEAKKLGYGHDLPRLFRQENRADLSLATERMNNAMIDYGDLGPIEQSIVRRVIFFYPWVKGASKWSVRFVAEHPIQAAAAAQAGVIGKQEQAKALGSDLPSWAEGLIPVGQKHGLPTTVNPSSISVLSTPVDLVQSIRQKQASNNLTPVLALAQAIYNKGVTGGAKDQVQSLPEAPLLGLARDSKTFPYERTPSEALLLWLLGSGAARRETNPDALARSAYFEKHPPHD